MALITDHVKENADKCKQCAFQKMRSADIGLDKTSVLYTEAMTSLEIAIEGISRATCSVCPYEKDFVKIYGVKPYEYFPLKLGKKEVKELK
jgi:hypothetical protein